MQVTHFFYFTLFAVDRVSVCNTTLIGRHFALLVLSQPNIDFLCHRSLFATLCISYFSIIAVVLQDSQLLTTT